MPDACPVSVTSPERLPLHALLPTMREGTAPRFPTVAALVGAGGKTSLLYALARLLTDSGLRVLTTTTTHIRPPTPTQTPHVLIQEEIPRPALLRPLLERFRHVTLARRPLPDQGKLAGFSPEALLALKGVADVLLVEADGAAMRPLKAPASHEPAVPPCAELCVAVLGLDGVGRTFATATHRPERAAALCNVKPEARILSEHLAHLALHSEGLFRACPATARRVVLCHKAELPQASEAALRAATTARRAYPESAALWFMGSVRQGWVCAL